ncbi:aquaporin-like protein [Microthyrium microscopicum]|uniref:Aquaporin-like protein n=1 Tax=Microthyrium microscopicum TaxID=703497 RepID=A0A6A6TYK0_9PEZI|nr:aquaporin-like protein [Microthyrium microscopicum]
MYILLETLQTKKLVDFATVSATIPKMETPTPLPRTPAQRVPSATGNMSPTGNRAPSNPMSPTEWTPQRTNSIPRRPATTPRRPSILPQWRIDSFEQARQAGQEPEKHPEHRTTVLWNKVRNEAVAFVGEFCGTFMFLFMAFSATSVANASANGTNNNTLTQVPNTSVLLYISLSFGFSLAVNAWAFFRISGGLFNPAVTLGLLFIGAISPFRAAHLFVAQLISAIAAAAVISGLFPGPLAVSTTLSAGTSSVQGVFIEMFLTAQLVFVVYMLGSEKHKATFLAPVGIGLSLFVSELCGVYFTGGSLNPARSFGPAVVTGFDGSHWIYWVGPLMGTLLAWGLFVLLKFAGYETANPGQDFDELETKAFNPPPTPMTIDHVERPSLMRRPTADTVPEEV